VTEDDELFAHLESSGWDVDVADVENVRELDPVVLLRKYHRVERDLTAMGELLIARTDKGREYHSRRSAYLFELRRRQMM
jgi:hypothetical protein